MEKDKMIEDLFADFRPELSDNDKFMASLNRKLDAVEYIKKMQEAQLRRYRLAITVTLGLAIVAGLALFFVINALPEGVKLFSFETNFPPLAFIEQNSRMIILIIIALLIGWGIIAISDTIQKNKI
ncbi:MAG: hypothetical protein J6129_03545 [Bacteroidaceae bacterium]|nr:hypothetical protein [Bacteroidaceae bacterium]